MIETTFTIYLEANVFIYAVEGTGDVSEEPKRLLAALRKHPGRAVTSELTLAEVLAPTTRPDALAPELKRSAYLDLLVESGFIGLVAVTRTILLETVSLRSAMRMKLADAIHLASAVHAKSQFFVSRDRDFRRLPEGMSWVAPDEGGVAQVLQNL
jgi:predicted nucleic acid-binding protein